MNPSPISWIERAAERNRRAPAIREETGRTLSYGELHERASAVAAGLRGRLSEREAVMLDLSPGIAHAVAMHGCVLAGLPFQTLRPGLPPSERERQGREAALLVGPDELDGLQEAGSLGGPLRSEPPDPDAILCRVMSSGTSGPPRPVGLSRANFEAAASASAHLLPLDPGSGWLCPLPLDHVGGLSILLRSAIAGSCAEVHVGFGVDPVARALERVDYVSLVPTQLARLLEAGAPLERARGVLLGGAAATRPLLEAARDAGLRLYPTYGLTEACSQVCTLRPEELGERLGSAGSPLPGIEVEIDAERAGESGEILVSGPTVAPESVAADGRLHTGDIGRLDADGYLWVEGRADDLIVSGGENVRPEEVEAALLEHPLVAGAAVAGREDPEWGEAVVAWVESAGGDLDPLELIEHCRERLAAPKVPKLIEMVEELPRTAAGKLQRRLLR